MIGIYYDSMDASLQTHSADKPLMLGVSKKGVFNANYIYVLRNNYPNVSS